MKSLTTTVSEGDSIKAKMASCQHGHLQPNNATSKTIIANYKVQHIHKKQIVTLNKHFSPTTNHKVMSSHLMVGELHGQHHDR